MDWVRHHYIFQMCQNQSRELIDSNYDYFGNYYRGIVLTEDAGLRK